MNGSRDTNSALAPSFPWSLMPHTRRSKNISCRSGGLKMHWQQIPEFRKTDITITDSGVPFGDKITLPLRPMIGRVGVTPKDGPRRSNERGEFGGSMGNCQITKGPTVYLPVSHEGGLLRILEEEGVDLNRVYLGHSNDDTDLDYLLGLLNKGIWLGLDRYPGGRTPETPNRERRTEVVKQLIDAGFAHRLMLSHDNSVPSTQPTRALAEQRQAFNPDGYLFITRRVLPRLKELGASDQDINSIMVGNPRRFFDDA